MSSSSSSKMITILKEAKEADVIKEKTFLWELNAADPCPRAFIEHCHFPPLEERSYLQARTKEEVKVKASAEASIKRGKEIFKSIQWIYSGSWLEKNDYSESESDMHSSTHGGRA
jgi:hypothetical protein